MNWRWFIEQGGWLVVIISVFTIIIEVNAFLGLDTNGLVAEQLRYIRWNFIRDLLLLIIIVTSGVIYQVKQK